MTPCIVRAGHLANNRLVPVFPARSAQRPDRRRGRKMQRTNLPILFEDDLVAQADLFDQAVLPDILILRMFSIDDVANLARLDLGLAEEILLGRLRDIRAKGCPSGATGSVAPQYADISRALKGTLSVLREGRQAGATCLFVLPDSAMAAEAA